ncbi:MAG: hydroxymethylglutaryl-CoA reductase, degradative, partial [Vagococcus salmoninarum]
MSSEFTKFYQKKRAERLALLTERGFLTASDQHYLLENPSLPESVADSLIENQLTQFPLPMGVALNFIVDQQEVVVPMVVEEPSVIAASSNGAKLARKHGGFQTTIT